MKANLPTNEGRPCLTGPGALEDVTLKPYRKGKRLQEIIFELAVSLTRDYVSQSGCEIPTHVLFPQLLEIVFRFVDEKLVAEKLRRRKLISVSRRLWMGNRKAGSMLYVRTHHKASRLKSHDMKPCGNQAPQMKLISGLAVT